MFLLLGQNLGANAVLTGYRPSQIAEYLEILWSRQRQPLRQNAVGPAVNALQHRGMSRPPSIETVGGLSTGPVPPPLPLVDWHHIVYAYMVENTRALDIGRRLVFEWLTGERLPAPTGDTARWLHTTEQLFFGQGWPYSVRTVTSHLRPDPGAVRRNAYYRLLGLDLNHGTDDGQAYPYVKPTAANREFAATLEALLIQAWHGYTNMGNSSGPSTTDPAAIMDLVRVLREMLQARRQGGILSREEFDAVAQLSWFHLLLQGNNAILQNLGVAVTGQADVLVALGQMVGVPCHQRSDSYLEMAEPLSRVLLAIEGGAIVAAPQLYNAGVVNSIAPDVLTVVLHWSIARGVDLKDPSMRAPIAATMRQIRQPMVTPAAGRLAAVGR